MGEVLQQASLQEPGPTFTMPAGRGDITQTLFDFLNWIEQTKGLTLCQEFKPQYDWYMPAFVNKHHLANEFLDNKPSGNRDKPNLERLP